MFTHKTLLVRSSCIAATLVALSGCNPISGQLAVNDTTALQGTRTVGDDCSFEALPVDCSQIATAGKQTIAPGTYQAEVDIASKSAVNVTLTDGDVAREFEFRIPDGFSIPRENGRFALRAQDVGQPVNLAGDVVTTRALSPMRSEWESCSYTVERLLCPQHRHHRNKHKHGHGHGHGQQRVSHRVNNPSLCTYQDVRVHGQQAVEFQFEQVTKKLVLVLSDINANTPKARFVGEQSTRDKHYRYRGICR
jgi:hypothetical protein